MTEQVNDQKPVTPWWRDPGSIVTVIVALGVAVCAVVLVLRGEYEIAIPLLTLGGAVPFTKSLVRR
jgi:hypothetical protein